MPPILPTISLALYRSPQFHHDGGFVDFLLASPTSDLRSWFEMLSLSLPAADLLIDDINIDQGSMDLLPVANVLS